MGPSNAGSSIRENVAMGWKVLLGVVILLLVGAVGLTILGSSVDPVQQPREEVLPNDRFGN